MGEVVPLFKKSVQPPKEVEQCAATPRQGGGKGESLTADVIVEMLRYVAPIRMHLSVLQGVVSDKNIRERKEGLRGYSDNDLLRMAQESTELDWNQRPAFYWALVEALEDRIIPPPPT